MGAVGREKTTEEDRHTLLSQSWLLKTVAIELRMTALNRQRSHTQRLLNLLLEGSTDEPQKGERAASSAASLSEIIAFVAPCIFVVGMFAVPFC